MQRVCKVCLCLCVWREHSVNNLYVCACVFTVQRLLFNAHMADPRETSAPVVSSYVYLSYFDKRMASCLWATR